MGEGWYFDFRHTHFDQYSPPDFYTRVKFNSLSSLETVLGLLQGQANFSGGDSWSSSGYGYEEDKDVGG